MKTKILPIFLILACCFNSCKDKDDLDSRLFGTWIVTKVQGQQYNNGTPGLVLADPSPTGYVRFDEDGTGEQNYAYTIFGSVQHYNDEFVWEADDDEIRIDLFNNPDMVWRRVTNEPDKQEATYKITVNTTQYWDYTLTLER